MAEDKIHPSIEEDISAHKHLKEVFELHFFFFKKEKVCSQNVWVSSENISYFYIGAEQKLNRYSFHSEFRSLFTVGNKVWTCCIPKFQKMCDGWKTPALHDTGAQRNRMPLPISRSLMTFSVKNSEIMKAPIGWLFALFIKNGRILKCD